LQNRNKKISDMQKQRKRIRLCIKRRKISRFKLKKKLQKKLEKKLEKKLKKKWGKN